MKRELFIVSVLLVFLMACSNDTTNPSTPEKTPTTTTTTDGTDKSTFTYSDVEGTSTLEFTHLDSNQMYSVVATDGSSLSSVDPLVVSRDSGKIVKTGIGTNIFIPKSDGTFSFTGSDVGITTKGRIDMRKIATGAYDDMMIEEKDLTKTMTIRGVEYKYGEEYYYIGDAKSYFTEKGLNADDIAIISIFRGSGSGNSHYGVITDFSDLTKGFDALSLASVMKLPTDKPFALYNALARSEGNISQELRMVNPVDLSLDTDADITSDATIFRIRKAEDSKKRYVIEITPASGIRRNRYGIVNDTANARLVTGYSRPYLNAINYDDNSILLYVGSIEEDFIFDLFVNEANATNYGTIKYREITAAEEESIRRVNLTSASTTLGETIQITAGEQRIIPMIITASDDDNLRSDFTISVECADTNCTSEDHQVSFVAVSSHENKIGKSRRSVDLNSGTPVQIRGNDIIEYAYLAVSNPSASHNVTLKITRSK